MAQDKLTYAHGDNVSDTTSNSIAAGDLLIPVDTISKWSSNGGSVIIDRNLSTNEIIKTSGKSGANLVVPSGGRGQGGTTAQSHNQGATIESVPVAEDWNDVIDTLQNAFVKATGAVDVSKIVGTDGWLSITDAWAYASATTITVPSGAAAKYAIGDKVKFTQSAAVGYYYITNVADTVLTVTGGTDYTVANSAISAISISHASTPLNFPQWFNYTPTYSASGSMTYTTVTTNKAVFTLRGRTMTIVVDATGTTGGSAANELRYTSPITYISNGNSPVGNGVVQDSGTVSGLSLTVSGTIIGVRRYDNANYGLGAGREITSTINCQI